MEQNVREWASDHSGKKFFNFDQKLSRASSKTNFPKTDESTRRFATDKQEKLVQFTNE